MNVVSAHLGPGRMIRSASGFTLLELMLAIVLVGVFAGILLGRFVGYQEMAEKAAMEQTAGAIRSALAIQSAALIARGRAEDIPKLLNINPMNLLRDAQHNYAGEYFEPRAGEIAPGSWYFDLKRKELVYLVHRGTGFASGPGAKAVRFKIGLVYNDDLTPAPLIAPRRELGGVTLYTVMPYRWMTE